MPRIGRGVFNLVAPLQLTSSAGFSAKLPPKSSQAQKLFRKLYRLQSLIPNSAFFCVDLLICSRI